MSQDKIICFISITKINIIKHDNKKVKKCVLHVTTVQSLKYFWFIIDLFMQYLKNFLFSFMLIVDGHGIVG